MNREIIGEFRIERDGANVMTIQNNQEWLTPEEGRPRANRGKGVSGQMASQPVQANTCQAFLSIGELAQRWRCSRGSVYNWLRAAGAVVVDFAARGRRGRKAVPLAVVLQIEAKKMKRL